MAPLRSLAVDRRMRFGRQPTAFSPRMSPLHGIDHAATLQVFSNVIVCGAGGGAESTRRRSAASEESRMTLKETC